MAASLHEQRNTIIKPQRLPRRCFLTSSGHQLSAVQSMDLLKRNMEMRRSVHSPSRLCACNSKRVRLVSNVGIYIQI